MLGLLHLEEEGRGRVRLEREQVLSLPVLRASLPRGGRREERRVDKAARLLTEQGVRRILPPREFGQWDALARRGLVRVAAAPLCRRMAAPLALAELERRGRDLRCAAVALCGSRVDGELERAARRLCPLVRDLVIDAPVGGERLARTLYWEYGMAVCPGPGTGTDVSLRFDGGGERCPGGELLLCTAQPDLDGLTLTVPGLTVPGELEPLPVLTALWEAGKLREEEMIVTGI